MKNRVQQLTFATKPPRWVLIVERADGSWNVMEDTEKELRAYRPKRDEQVKLHRVLK